MSNPATFLDLALAQRLKRWLALVIVLCFFLPLAQCTHQATPGNTPTTAHKPVVEDYVPASLITWNDPSDWVMLADFLWPVVTGLIAWRWRGRRPQIAVNTLEVLLCLAAAAHIAVIIHVWGHVRYGGLVLLLTYALYAGVAGALAWIHFRTKTPHARESAP